MKTAIVPSPLGEILLAAEDGALCGLWFVGQKYEGAGLTAGSTPGPVSADPVLEKAQAWLESYFDGANPEIGFPLAPRGTAFQRAVWDALLDIPYGQTTTYGELARRLGGASARAVGGAVGRNPVSIIIPCHRVLGADGRLTGYAGGLERKRYLLRLEGAKILK